MLDIKEIEDLRTAFGRVRKPYKKQVVKESTCSQCGGTFLRVRAKICRSCYLKNRWQKNAAKHPERITRKEQIAKKEARVAEMRRLHTEEGKTLQEVGDMYGISRERVRQLIGNMGYGFPAAYDNKTIASHPEMTNAELCSFLGRTNISRGDHRHAVEGYLRAGVEAEDAVSKILTDNGIQNKLMPHHHPFDILLADDKRVDVKSRKTKTIPPSVSGKMHTAAWHFALGLKRRGDYADFFILYLGGDCFVIPATEAKEIIRFCWPPANRPSKWHKYHNRFDLLKGE